MARRLDGPFGFVEASFADRVAPWIAGQRVLDVGCGFGSLANNLRLKGFDAVGVDMLDEFIEIGKGRYPAADLRVVQDATLPFPDKSFDTVVLKDTIHHVFAEGDLAAFLTDLNRVCRQRIIVIDPNPTLILRISRRLIGHVDPVCSPQSASDALKEAGFKVIHKEFHEILGFPLSGGYVGRPLIPLALAPAIGQVDRAALGMLRALGIEQHICWRYMLVGILT
jgi:ubiquinone/menaquinone biosynthesis C-methylase UbiE